MSFFNILLGFILIGLIETVNGIFRIKVLFKYFERSIAKRLSFLLGLLLIIVINILLIPWIKPKNVFDAIYIGFIWATLMMIYDIFVGKFLFKLSWKNIINDFNIFEGNLLSYGILSIIIFPTLVFLFMTKI